MCGCVEVVGWDTGETFGDRVDLAYKICGEKREEKGEKSKDWQNVSHIQIITNRQLTLI